jgi:hypothetical protein
MLAAVAVRVSDALVPRITVAQGEAPLVVPADSAPPASSAAVSVVSAIANRIAFHVRQAGRRSCRLLDG